MNPILHQTKWDFRRIRTFWLLWIGLLILTTALRHVGLTRPSSDLPLLLIPTLLEMVVVYALGSLLVTVAVVATPFPGSTAFWKTKPLTRRALFRQKTLFILVVFWFPAVASRGVQYLLIDPDPGILIGLALTFAPLTLGFYLLAATWAAICVSRRQLTAGLAGTVGFAMLSFMFVAFMSPSGPLIMIGSRGPHFVLHTLVAALFLMAILFFLAWWHAARLKMPVSAMSFLAFGILLTVSQSSIWGVNFGDQRSSWIDQELNLEVLDQDHERQESVALLCPQLGVTLPPGQLITINHIDARFIPTGARQPTYETSAVGRDTTTGRQLARHYPSGTRLILGAHFPRQHAFLADDLGREPGTFSGEYSGRLFESARLGSIPAIEGASRSFRGHGRVSVSHRHSSGLNLRLHTVERAGASHFGSGHSFSEERMLYAILRHTQSPIIIAPEHGSIRGSGGFNLIMRTRELYVGEEALHTALGRAPGPDALSDFVLDLYALTPIGAVAGEFRKDDWIPFTESSPVINETPVRPASWTEAVLPEHPTDAQVDSYLALIIHGLPREVLHEDQKTLQSKLDILGSTHLGRLIMRFPVPHYFRHHAMNTIRQHVTREHLPALLAAFKRDPRLAEIVVQNRWRVETAWQADAVSIARAHLRHRGPFYSGTATHLVAIATVNPDPALNDDLYHHFVIADGGHSSMIRHLRRQPGFPLDDAIGQAWNRQRSGLTASARDLAYHAIRLGDPEALRQAIAHFTELTNPHDRNFDDERALLDAGIDQPEGTDPAIWARAHFTQLHFDPLRKVFHLPE